MFRLVTKMIRTNWLRDLFCALISDLTTLQCLGCTPAGPLPGPGSPALLRPCVRVWARVQAELRVCGATASGGRSGNGKLGRADALIEQALIS